MPLCLELEGVGEMPTDVAALLARKKYAQAQSRNDAKLMSMVCGVCLLMIEMVFVSARFEHAMILVGAC